MALLLADNQAKAVKRVHSFAISLSRSCSVAGV